MRLIDADKLVAWLDKVDHDACKNMIPILERDNERELKDGDIQTYGKYQGWRNVVDRAKEKLQAGDFDPEGTIIEKDGQVTTKGNGERKVFIMEEEKTE